MAGIEEEIRMNRREFVACNQFDFNASWLRSIMMNYVGLKRVWSRYEANIDPAMYGNVVCSAKLKSRWMPL